MVLCDARSWIIEYCKGLAEDLILASIQAQNLFFLYLKIKSMNTNGIMYSEVSWESRDMFYVKKPLSTQTVDRTECLFGGLFAGSG